MKSDLNVKSKWEALAVNPQVHHCVFVILFNKTCLNIYVSICSHMYHLTLNFKF